MAKKQDKRPNIMERVKMGAGKKVQVLKTMMHPAAKYDTSEKGLTEKGKEKKSTDRSMTSGVSKTTKHGAFSRKEGMGIKGTK